MASSVRFALALTWVLGCAGAPDTPTPAAPTGGTARSAPRTNGSFELVRTPLAALPSLGEVSDLAPAGPDELLVAGTRGLGRLTLTSRTLNQSITFADTLPLAARIVDLAGDGRLSVLRLAAHGRGPALALSVEGSVLWRYDHGDAPPLATFVLDIDDDGDQELLMSFVGSDEVHLIDHWGRRLGAYALGRPPLDVIAAPAGPGLLAIDGEALVLVGPDGRVLSRARPPGGGYVNGLYAVAPGAGAGAVLLTHVPSGGGGQRFHVYAGDGRTHLEQVSPERAESLLATTPLETHAGSDLRIRIEARHSQSPLTGFAGGWLRVQAFDPHGVRTYEDRIPGPRGAQLPRSAALLALPGAEPSVVVGYGPELHRYAVRR